MTIRWGIVSAGKISHDFVNAFNSFPDVGDQLIAAVVARDKNRAAEFAKLHKIEKVFDNYETLAKSGDIDVAYIGVLNVDHYRLSKLFLENGKHVLCEKPLCLNSKQAQSLVNLAKKHNRFLMEAVWSRFAPIYQVLEKELQSGKLGDVKHVDAALGFNASGRIISKALGNSAIIDVGVYPLQFAQFVFKDEPIKVTSYGKLDENGTDIIETVILEYTGDRRAVLNVDLTVGLSNSATVSGTKGKIKVEEPFHFPEVLVHVDGAVEKLPLHTSDINYFYGNNSAGLVYQTLEVARCINNGLIESPKLPHKEMLILAKLEDTVRKQIGVHFEADDEDFS